MNRGLQVAGVNSFVENVLSSMNPFRKSSFRFLTSGSFPTFKNASLSSAHLYHLLDLGEKARLRKYQGFSFFVMFGEMKTSSQLDDSIDLPSGAALQS